MHGLTTRTTAVFKIRSLNPLQVTRYVLGSLNFLSTRVSSVSVTEPKELALRNVAMESMPVFILFSIAQHFLILRLDIK
jgi:hypothetical protein